MKKIIFNAPAGWTVTERKEECIAEDDSFTFDVLDCLAPGDGEIVSVKIYRNPNEGFIVPEDIIFEEMDHFYECLRSFAGSTGSVETESGWNACFFVYQIPKSQTAVIRTYAEITCNPKFPQSVDLIDVIITFYPTEKPQYLDQMVTDILDRISFEDI